MSTAPSLIVFGEVLFDHFPDGQRRLGGAPFNVARHLQAMGHAPMFISRVGDDPQAQEINKAMQQWQMNCAGLQTDSSHPTGRVQVSLENNEPSYDIVADCAYDFIDAQLIPSISKNGLLYHGSLALRNAASRNALATIKQRFNGTVFLDVNLRDPWWSKQTLLQDIAEADWVKLNFDEFKQLGLAEQELESAAKHCLQKFDLDGIIITQGEAGALAVTHAGEVVQVTPKPVDQIIDCVGAGDAFTSVIIAGLISRWPLVDTMQRGQQLASAIVTIRGALPESPDFYKNVFR